MLQILLHPPRHMIAYDLTYDVRQNLRRFHVCIRLHKVDIVGRIVSDGALAEGNKEITVAEMRELMGNNLS